MVRIRGGEQRKRVDEKSVDVPVLVVGTKSINHVEKLSVPSVGQVAPRAPSVQKSNGSGNFNLKNKMPSPRSRKPGPKRRNTNGSPHFPVATMPYPNGENPKHVSPAAAGQGFTPPAHAIDAKHVQPPVQEDLNAYAVNYPNGRPNIQEQGDQVNHGRHHQRPFPAKANMPMQHSKISN